MDAKSKANFINSVGAGAEISCPKCAASNTAGSTVCAACGAALVAAEDNKSAAAFEQTKPSVKASAYKEPSTAFAQGLPAWSLEPPMVMVRRH